MPTTFASLLPGRCMASFTLHFFLLIKKLLSSAPTSFPSLVNSSMEKKSTRWKLFVPTEDPLADNNTWSLGKTTPALSVIEIPLVDKDTERELFSLLGDWYEPESIESLFSSSPSDAVFFSS